MWSICRHPWCGPKVTRTVNRISIGPNMSPMVKSDFHHIWPCVKPLDGKVGQTIALDWPHVVGVFVVVFWSITTFIPIKQSFHSIKSKDTRTTNPRTCKNDQWKRFVGFETIPNMSKVIIYYQFFYILLRGQILGNVPLDHSLHIPSFTLQKLRDMSMGDVCGFNCHLVLASMPKPIFPHQVYIRERWLCWVLDHDGLGQWNSPNVFNCQRNNLVVGVLNLWKPMEYPQKFINCNNLNQQNH